MASQTPVILFIVIFMAVIAHHLWRRHDRVAAVVVGVIAYELLHAEVPFVGRAFSRVGHLVGLTAPAFAPLLIAVLTLGIMAYGFRRMFISR
jgi:membrane protease YdiL (CAAX protease family)